MVRSHGAAVLLALSALSGCGQAPSDQAGQNAAGSSAQASIKVRNEWQEKLLTLSASERDLTLRRAVTDDGGSCPRIRGSKYQENYKGMAMWVAHCSNEDWAIYIAPSGAIQARACKDIPVLNRQSKQLGLPACHPWPADPLAPVAAPSWPEPAPPPEPIDKL